MLKTVSEFPDVLWDLTFLFEVLHYLPLQWHVAQNELSQVSLSLQNNLFGILAVLRAVVMARQPLQVLIQSIHSLHSLTYGNLKRLLDSQCNAFLSLWP